MSGICGIISESSKYGKKDLKSMLELLSHNGDNLNFFQDENLLMGIVYDEKDNFSFFEADKLQIFFDGLIYNQREILNELNLSYDKEVISCAELVSLIIDQLGVGSLDFINGDYIVVIRDRHSGEVSFSKYLTNSKNIFYREINDDYLFASEMKSLLNFGECENRIDYNSVSDFLTFGHIPTPRTLFKGVRRVEPATVTTLNEKVKRSGLNFFEPRGSMEYDLKQLPSLMFNRFEESVKKRVDSISDFGLYLSGGVDSSTLLYFLNKLSDRAVDTYTVGLNKDEVYSDRISSYFDTNHTNLELGAKELIDIAPKALWHIEYPLDHAGVFQYYFPQISRDKKYMFWGQGAEEVVFGRKDYVALNMISNIKKITPNFIKGKLYSILPQLPNKNRYCFYYNIFLSNNDRETYVSLRELMTENERKKLFYDRVAENDLSRVIKAENIDNLLNSYSYLTMMNGFLSDSFPSLHQQLLNPFLDKDFLDFSYSIPSRLKVKNNTSRYLLKKMMTGKLPDYIIKRGRDSWSDQTKQIITENKDIFYHFANRLKDRKILKENIDDFSKRYKYKLDEKLWSLMSLELLFEMFIDNRFEKEPPKLENLI